MLTEASSSGGQSSDAGELDVNDAQVQLMEQEKMLLQLKDMIREREQRLAKKDAELQVCSLFFYMINIYISFITNSVDQYFNYYTRTLTVWEPSVLVAVSICRLFVPRQISKISRGRREISSPLSEIGSESKNMMSDFAPEVVKCPKKPQILQNGDLDN